LILDDNEKNTKAQRDFFSKYGTIARDASVGRVQVQGARHDSTPFFSRYTQMHQTAIITEAFTFFGSYNLSCPVRCASWESMVCVESTDSDVADFDKLWRLLADTKRKHEEKKKRAALGTAAMGSNARLKRSELNRGRINKDVIIATKSGLKLNESFVFVDVLGGIEGQVVEEAANEINPPMLSVEVSVDTIQSVVGNLRSLCDRVESLALVVTCQVTVSLEKEASPSRKIAQDCLHPSTS
jgi:hypothetical protein